MVQINKIKHPEVKYTLPHYVSSDDKILSIAVTSIPLGIVKQQSSCKKYRSYTETRHGLSNQWLNWLTGLIEADGSFPNSKKSLSFYISQSIKNAPLLYAIKFWLGFGKIRWQLSENMVHYVIEDIPSLEKLANLLNGRFRTEEKFEAYLKFIQRLNTKSKVKYLIIVKPLNLVLDYDWLSGFTIGDGSFFIGLGKTPKSKLGVQLTLNVSWTQKHKKPLDLIASEFGGGFSYNKTKEFWVLTIKRQSEIKKLLYSVYVDSPIWGIKRLDYLDLVKVCDIFKSKQHLTESGLDLILKIRSNMNNKRKVW